MHDWYVFNTQLRADRDFINDTARKAAEARESVAPLPRNRFLALADRFADQERQTAAQAERHWWK